MDTQRLTELKSMPYDEYLQTPEWAVKRDQTLERDKHLCRACNSNEKLQVHHRTYARRGNEDLNDLTTLCQPCHEHFHERIRQIDLMGKTYSPIPTLKKEAVTQKWEEYLIGLLLLNRSLHPYICGILSEDEFAISDTRKLYQLLNSISSPDQPIEQLLPPALIPTARRSTEAVKSDVEADIQTQVKIVVDIAIRLKRHHLVKTSGELLGSLKSAVAAGDHSTGQQLLQELTKVNQKLRTIDAINGKRSNHMNAV